MKHIIGNIYLTDYPFSEIGETANTTTLKQVRLLSYDGDKYCVVEYKDIKKEIKLGYLYMDYEKNIPCNILNKIVTSLKVLANIADAYDDNGLDECRPEWATRGLEEFNLDKELYSGRGGKTLLKLRDVFEARELLRDIQGI